MPPPPKKKVIIFVSALIRNPRILLLDEATSALDTKTEEAVMSSIGDIGRNITIIMIAHRVSTLKYCDLVYRLEHGKITENIEETN